MFKGIGILVAAYTAWAILNGRVHAKAGIGLRQYMDVVTRDERPGYYWTVIVIYAGLSIALLTVF